MANKTNTFTLKSEKLYPGESFHQVIQIGDHMPAPAGYPNKWMVVSDKYFIFDGDNYRIELHATSVPDK